MKRSCILLYRSHWITILLPVEIPPTSDGWKYSKIPGWEEFAMEFDDELTDEEEVSDNDDE